MSLGTVRLGLLATHPVQYQVPWYRALARTAGVDLTVLYCMLPNAWQQGVGFDIDFQWDLPLLDGYRHVVLPNVARAPGLAGYSGCDTPSIRGLIAGHSFDALIISGWGMKSYMQALLACRSHGVPAIVRGESNGLKPRPWPLRLAHRMLLSQYSAFLAIGKANADFYVRHGVPWERVFSGPYCVDNIRFQFAARSLESRRHELRARWGIPLGASVFLYCGKLVEKKRPLDLLRALDLVIRSPSVRPVHLLVVGDGPLRARCEQAVAESRLPVSFAGFLNQTEIPEAYAAVDCLVLPSDYGETWGLVVNEAMASGRPAIVSDRVGCHPDLILPERTGAVFPFGDITALANTLRTLSAEPRRLREMGSEAQARLSSYDVDRLVEGTLEAVRYVMAAPEAAIISSS